ncbi:MAG TPA: ABC transporter ATP-binding protein [Anaerolineae bacterium]|nr:ABC transporter ATP-binding protein [Anaerolineae bacterium]
MISVQNVNKTYVTKALTVPAVHNVSLEVEPGEFVVITGRSGSGKTTLLSLVAGLTRPTSGQVLLDGVAVWSLPDKEQSLLRNEKIGFVFQFPSLLPTLTALENVMLPAMFGPPPAPPKQGGGKGHAVQERARHLLEQVGLADKLRSYPRQLSGGQQQRVVIARALMNEPELLLADEPTSDLDEMTEHEIMSLFRDIHQKTGVTVLLVTHSADLGEYGTRSIHMAGGEIVK